MLSQPCPDAEEDHSQDRQDSGDGDGGKFQESKSQNSGEEERDQKEEKAEEEQPQPPPSPSPSRQSNSMGSDLGRKSSLGGGDFGRRRHLASPLVSPWLSRQMTYTRLHNIYFVVISLIGTAFLWCFPKHGKNGKLKFIDAMFNAASSACTTGLISVRMRTFSKADDILLMVYMVLGSTITTALIPVVIRRFQFQRNIAQLESTIIRQNLRVHPSNSNSNLVDAILNNSKSRTEDCGLKRRHEKLDAMRLEADALTALCWIVAAFFFGISVIAFLVLELFVLTSPATRATISSYGVHHVFFSIFTAISSVTNSGILLLDDNMVPLRGHSWMLLWMSFLILIGNTMFAPCLRATIYLLRRFSRHPRTSIVLDFLLENPRKCFTHLFPTSDTIWLVITVMAFNAIESIMFYALSWNSSSIKGLTVWQKLVNGVFQSVTTRSAGLNVVPIGSLSPPMLVLYVGMMYVAVYPVYLTRQNSQAPHSDDEDKYGPHSTKKDTSWRTHLRNLIIQDSAFLFMVLFVLCLIEKRRIVTDPLNFSIFNMIFEVISAYGNVGLSIGYSCSLYKELHSNSSRPCVDIPYSFSGTWSIGGKLIMIFIMLMGRNRGLTDDMDMAVQLPKGFDEDEEELIQLNEMEAQHEQVQQFEEQVMEQHRQQIEMMELMEQHKPPQNTQVDVL